MDHRNGDPLDNRLKNLRACTRAENNRNRRINLSNRAGMKGVSQNPHSSKWQARIQAGGRQIYLGSFETPEEAHSAYTSAARLYHGDFACAG
ncbi:HNH endonuclease [Rhizobium sp. No.120]